MLTVTKHLVLPTTLTGSLPRPQWYSENLEGRPFSVMLNQVRFREQYFDALACFISDQNRAGLDILVDGDCRFDTDIGGRAWLAYPMERMGGLTGHSGLTKFKMLDDEPPGTILRELQGGHQWPEVTGKLTRGEMEYAKLWKASQILSKRPVKFGTVSAQCIEGFYRNHYYKNDEEMLGALCDVMNEELRDLANAGCGIIQVEEPIIHFAALNPAVKDKEMQKLVNAFNREVRGVKAEVWYHSCWGNPSQQRVFREVQSYERGLDWMLQCDCDVITLETASTNGMDLPLLKHLKTKKKFAIGVIDHRNLQIETPQQVAALIRKALKYVEPRQLIISTDCGFGREGIPRRNAFYKMVALVQGTNLVRKELSLPQAEVMAADPKMQLV
ncbi:MAG: cobalamin-independent methionine synthase II family protein [Verrucomicrobia bacterium]|nr:cobalamin-independent methionine synthase II family protein [Verrucomicrobiota bacterium]